MTTEKPPPRELRATGALLLLVIHGLGFLILLAFGQALFEDEMSLVFVLAASVVAPLLALYVGLVRYAPAEPTWAAMRFTTPDRRGLAIVGLAAAFGACAAPVLHAVGSALATPPSAEALDAWKALLAAPGAMLTFVIARMLVIPFVEEALYRGFVQPRLVKLVGVMRGIGLTFVFYAAASGSSSSLLELAVAAPLGFIAHAGGTTWAPLAARVIMIAGLMALDVAPTTPRWWVAAACGVAAAGALALIWRTTRATTAPRSAT